MKSFAYYSPEVHAALGCLEWLDAQGRIVVATHIGNEGEIVPGQTCLGEVVKFHRKLDADGNEETFQPVFEGVMGYHWTPPDDMPMRDHTRNDP